MKYWSLLLWVSLFWVACSNEQKQNGKDELPILGQEKEVNGKMMQHQIPDFAFLNQDSVLVTNETFKDKIYVADFFFTSCPTICPKVKKQMQRIYDNYSDNPSLLLLSHTIDVKRDTVGKLREFAENMGVSSSRWHFVTGDHDKIYEIADDYFSIAIEDPNAPEGFDHSGRLLLIDENRHIRAFADGTDEKEVNRFMKDIDKLLLTMQRGQ
jgi:protein SCO1/2